MLINLGKLLVIILMTAITACQPSSPIKSQLEVKKELNEVMAREQVEVKNSSVEQWHKVTVKYFDFEGGFYGLISNEGKKFLPMNLTKKYRVDGTLLEVKGKVIKDMMTIQQWGTAFNITEVNLIKLGKGDHKNIL